MNDDTANAAKTLQVICEKIKIVLEEMNKEQWLQKLAKSCVAALKTTNNTTLTMCLPANSYPQPSPATIKAAKTFVPNKFYRYCRANTKIFANQTYLYMLENNCWMY